MAGTVGDIGDEVEVVSFRTAEQPVNRVYQHLDDVDVLPFVESAYVVGLGNPSLMEDEVYRPRMVLDIQPVAHILAPAIDRKRSAVADVVDEERYQLLRELVRAVVVGAVRDYGRHAVSIVECPHEMVARRLGRAVRAVRLVFQVFGEEFLTVGEMVPAAGCLRRERRFYAVGMGHLQGAVHFVRRDVVEALSVIAFRK